MRAREALRFVAELRLPANEVDERCEALLEELGLVEQRDTFVGGILAGGLRIRGLSGGQKRRLSLAIGLVSKAASALVLDEPMSGLDAAGALGVAQMMRRVADESAAVFCSLHAPRLAVLACIDQLHFLSAGRAVCAGTAARALSFLSSLGFRPPGDGTATNPADAVLDIISIDFIKDPNVFGIHTMRDLADVDRAADAWTATAYPRHDDEEHGAICAMKIAASDESLKRDEHSRFLDAPPFLTQYCAIAKRAVRLHVRHPGNVIARFALICLVAILLLAVFGQVRCNFSLDDVRSSPSIFSHFQHARNSTFSYLLFPALQAFVPLGILAYDRQFYIREAAHRLYYTAAYYFAYTTVESGFVAITNFLVALVYARAAGLSGSQALHMSSVAVAVAVLNSQIVMFAVNISNSTDVAFVVAASFFIHGFITSGFAVRIDDFSSSFSWIGFVSTFKFIFEIHVRALFGVDFANDEGYSAASNGFRGDIFGALALWLCLHPPAYLALRFLYKT